MTSQYRKYAIDLKEVLLPWFTTRVLIGAGFIVAYAASEHLVPTDKPNVLSEGLIAWDGTWYRDIAMHGYGNDLAGLRFFPLFPVLGRAFSVVTFGRADVALIVIANIAALFLAIGVRRLVLFERGSRELANRAVWMVCLFPGAFVLAWGYAESIWLCAAVAGFWAIRSRRWGWAIVAGLILGFSRPLGIAFAVPALIECARVWRHAKTNERALGVAAVTSPFLATGAYLFWVGKEFGDAWLPFTVQNNLRGVSMNPLSRIWEGFSQMFGAQRLGDGLHIPFALAFIALLVFTFRWWPVSYGLFAAVVLTAALGAENLNSLERYGINAFPLALTLAVATQHQRSERVVTTVLAGGVVALSALAWTGAYVP
ncbi:MAG: mannosyltransferase family protein [Actinobacteria bacterium]|nr:mannosyltransferase family protein [Actinomycetota bacterium]